jgi:aminoglycoside 3-N-acetyltransferase
VSERSVIDGTNVPVTRQRIVDDVRALGVEAGDLLVVHTSLSALGYVTGGAQAVVEALLEVVGEAGTVTMPAHCDDLSEPSRWVNPPVPADWWPVLRAHMPAFDPRLTPLRGMGAVAATLLRAPGVLRSAHPRVSHMALGPHAPAITEHHQLEDGMAEASPLARLYELDAKVLLLGVGHANNTSLHLAEYRADWPAGERITQGSPVLVDGQRRWVTYEELDGDSDDFEMLGAAFAATGAQRTGTVGQGTAHLMSQRAVVDFGVDWISRHRS